MALQVARKIHRVTVPKCISRFFYKADNSWTEEDFKQLIQSLREDAHVFLKMINEVKRKLNMLDDKNTMQGMQYKYVLLVWC